MAFVVWWTVCYMVIGLAAVSGVLLLSVTIYLAYIRYKYRHIPSPPCSSFFFGHLLELNTFKQQGNYVGNLLLQWAREYGSVFVLFVLHKPMIIVSGTSPIKEILTNSKYPKSREIYAPFYSLFGVRFLGRGLLTETDHSKWHRRRAVVNPAFHKRYLSVFLKQFNDVGDRWVKSLSTVADGKTVFSMHEYVCRVTSDAIAEVGFHDNLNTIESRDDQFLVALLNCLRVIALTSRDPLVKYRPSLRQFRQTVRHSAKLIRSRGQKLLDERLKAMERGQETPDDILSNIIKYKEADPSLTDEDLLDDYMTLFFAGQETTSNALSFMFCELGKRPEIVQKIREEIDEVLGSRCDVEYEDLGKLEYCGQVFKELLRMYPVAPGTSREAVEEVELDGYRIPAGSSLLVSSYAVHRLEWYYDDPEEFRPERFSESRILYSYMPFSLGQRSCIGQQFAKIEVKVLMCKFFKNYDFALDMNQSFSIEETATLRPQGGAMMTLSPRR